MRPRVTLAYASSLDGSIAARPGAPLALSGPESLRYTHQLRAQHDAILVGIGTVLADDPQLSVRLVQGTNPRPVILDTRLRCPLTARALDPQRRPIIVTRENASPERRQVLETAGVTILRVSAAADGRLDLGAVLSALSGEGMRTVMVEGGAQVITAFLRARLVDRLVLTLAPVLVGGVRGVTAPVADEGRFPRLRHPAWRPLGEDWIVEGELAQ